MLCRLKDIVIFVGGEFSLDMSIYSSDFFGVKYETCAILHRFYIL